MRFAKLNGERIEPTPKARASCPGCGSEVIARCGTKKVWHWAHKGSRHCDHWWENETQWHRDWKNRFPLEWQEIPARDEHGELHIADVKTNYGLVLEFQHSAIKPEEVQTRTEFYRDIVWIVDGTRRKTDVEQYKRLISENWPTKNKGVDIYKVHYRETRLLKEWGMLGKTVGFDFGGDTICLLTNGQNQWRYLFNYSKNRFVELVNSGEDLPQVVIVPRKTPSGRGRIGRYRRRFR